MLDRVLHLLLRHLDQDAAAVVLRGQGLGPVPGDPGVHLRSTAAAGWLLGRHSELLEEEDHLHLRDGYPHLGVFVQHPH